MPQPSSFVDWDTGDVHTTPVTGGHAASGWAHAEPVPSDELNQWMMLVGLWVRYLVGLMTSTLKIHSFAGQSVAVDPTTGNPTATTFTFRIPQGATGISGATRTRVWAKGALGQLFGVPGAGFETLVTPIKLPIGAEITAVRAVVKDGLTSNTVGTFTLFKDTLGGGGSVVGAVRSSGGGTQQTLSIGSLTETVASNTYYSLQINPSNTSGTPSTSADFQVDVFEFEVDYVYLP